jgi:ParB-like chromosome segregation protein Spo0J
MENDENIQKQPVNNIQWIDRELLKANAYNPNHVAPPEMELLKLSILEDGWTQPIVIRPDYEIIDGYHRYTVSGEPEIKELTNGKVPCVILNVPYEHQILSTVRHNRARGIHGVDPMSELIAYLIEKGQITKQELQTRLQMDKEEVNRLYDNSGMPMLTGKEHFSKGWKPNRNKTKKTI